MIWWNVRFALKILIFLAPASSSYNFIKLIRFKFASLVSTICTCHLSSAFKQYQVSYLLHCLNPGIYFASFCASIVKPSVTLAVRLQVLRRYLLFFLKLFRVSYKFFLLFLGPQKIPVDLLNAQVHICPAIVNSL